MLNVLVTGGKGFVGKHLVRAMRSSAVGYSITVLDKDGYTGEQRDEWDGIVHLAALSRVSDAEKDPALCMDSNLVLTAALLKQRAKWMVLASTCSPPTSVYGMSKLWCEQLCTHEANKSGMALRILRFTSIHGEGENKEKLLPMAIAAVRGNLPFSLSESALPLEYVGIWRVVNEILEAMLHADLHPGSIYPPKKLCDGTLKTRQELMEFARNVVHSNPQPA